MRKRSEELNLAGEEPGRGFLGSYASPSSKLKRLKSRVISFIRIIRNNYLAIKVAYYRYSNN